MVKSITPVRQDFWCPRFGVCDYASFKALAVKLAGGFLNFAAGPVVDAFAQDAWDNPSSGNGLIMQAALITGGYGSPENTSGGAFIAQTFPTALDALLETTMATLIIPDAFQVTIHMQCGGQTVDNVVGVLNAGGTAQGATDAVKFAWENAGGPLGPLPAALEVVEYVGVDLSSAMGDIATDSSTATGGDSTHEIATRGAAALWKWNGGNRSRSTRGRMYLGPLTENLVDSDGASLTSTAITGLTGNMDQFLQNLGGSGYPLCVLSRKLSIATPVTSHTLETTIATQRRRIRS